MIIQKSDKRNSITLIGRVDYLQKVANMLFDSSKFTEGFAADEKHQICLDSLEKQITDLLKQLKLLSDTNYKKLKPEVPHWHNVSRL